MAVPKFNVENDGMHIKDIVSRTPCPKHGAEKGVPCFLIQYNSSINKYGFAICNLRVITAGFNGSISEESLNLRRKSRFKRT